MQKALFKHKEVEELLSDLIDYTSIYSGHIVIFDDFITMDSHLELKLMGILGFTISSENRGLVKNFINNWFTNKLDQLRDFVKSYLSESCLYLDAREWLINHNNTYYTLDDFTPYYADLGEIPKCLLDYFLDEWRKDEAFRLTEIEFNK